MRRFAALAVPLVLSLACAGSVGPGERRVAIPVRDLAPGEVVAEEDVRVIGLPPDYVPVKGVVTEPELLVGRTVREHVLVHELFREERLGPAPAGARPDPAWSVPEPGVPEPSDTVMVIVSAADLPPGHVILEEELYAVQIPPQYLPEGVFLSPEHVVGRPVCERILPNELVRAARLWDPEGPCTTGGPAGP